MFIPYCRNAIRFSVLYLCYFPARNAVIVVLTAGIAAVLKDIYSIEGLTLTGKIESGMLPPMVPKLSMEYIDHDTNKTVFVSTGKIFSVSALSITIISYVM